MWAKEVERVLATPNVLQFTSDNILYKTKAINERTPYITYQLIDSYAGLKAEGERKSTVYVVQVDVNKNDTNFTDIKKEIIKQAKLNNWKREDGEFEAYDDNSEVFFLCLRFSFAIFEEE